MSDDKIQYDVHDYSPVNKYIEDQIVIENSSILSDIKECNLNPTDKLIDNIVQVGEYKME